MAEKLCELKKSGKSGSGGITEIKKLGVATGSGNYDQLYVDSPILIKQLVCAWTFNIYLEEGISSFSYTSATAAVNFRVFDANGTNLGTIAGTSSNFSYNVKNAYPTAYQITPTVSNTTFTNFKIS